MVPEVKAGKYYEFKSSTKESWIVFCHAVNPRRAVWNDDKPIYYLEFLPINPAPEYINDIVRVTPKDLNQIAKNGGTLIEIDEKSDKYRGRIAKLLLRRN